jgi:HSP20 family protein
MSGRDPFSNFDRMRREMDELFGDMLERSGLARQRAVFAPAIDVFYEEGPPPRAVVVVDVAGIDPDAVAIEIQGRELLLRGHREPAQAAGRLYQQLEIATGPFERRVQLGADVVADQARAIYEDGMLRIELPLMTGSAARRRVPIEVREPGS